MNTTSTENRWVQPKFVTRLESVFDRRMDDLLPPWGEIPKEFKNSYHPWAQEVSRIFFKGGSVENWRIRDGIDRAKAIAHLTAILRSWEPKHEHKEAGCAYLLSLWFELEAPKRPKC